MSSPPPFAFGDRVGLLLLFATSAVSASAILLLLSYITYSAVTITRDAIRRWKIQGAAEVYLLNQLAWDLLQAVGGMMNIKWAIDASVRPSSICAAQGAVKQASDVGAGLSTLIIAIFTIRTLCFSKTIDLRWSLVIVTVQWIAVTLIVAVNIAVDGAYHFYGPTGLWCWIQGHYSVQRTVADFVFMWITAAFNIAIYIIVFLYFRGYVTTDGWRISLSRAREPIKSMGPLRQAYGLLLYPFTYTVAVLPVSIARYRSFAHHPVPHSATFFADVIYLSNGLFNVLLFSTTRPALLPHDPSTTTVESRQGPPQIGLDQIGLHTDAEPPRQPGGSPTNPHTPQLDGGNDEVVQPSTGESYDSDVASLV